jgi:hypothetical protein
MPRRRDLVLLVLLTAALAAAVWQVRAMQRERAIALSRQSWQASEAGDAMAGLRLALAAGTPAGFGWLRPPDSNPGLALRIALNGLREDALLVPGSFRISAMAVGPAGEVAVTELNNRIVLWDRLDGPRPAGRVLLQDGANSRHSQLAFLPDGRLLALVGARPAGDGTFAQNPPRVIDPSGRVVHELAGHDRPVWRFLVRPDGTVVTGDTAGGLILWDLSGAEPRAVALDGHERLVSGLFHAPDGRVVSVAEREAEIRVHGLRADRPDVVLPGHAGGTHDAAVLPDGRMVTAGSDGALRIWDLDAAVPLTMVLPTPLGPLGRAVVGPGGELVAVSFDGRAIVWRDLGAEAAPGVLLDEVDGLPKLRHLLFARTGEMLTAHVDGTVRIWRGDTRRPITFRQADVGDPAGLQPHDRAVMLPDGRLLLAGRGSASVFHLRPGTGLHATLRWEREVWDDWTRDAEFRRRMQAEACARLSRGAEGVRPPPDIARPMYWLQAAWALVRGQDGAWVEASCRRAAPAAYSTIRSD